ncbi:MAG: hypothetical protein KDJ31_04810 [Candidatus Competibacteraceae bacterium]|nr:hypothetical protein [Candidatus Competibacteraceae bacterium]MCB1820702.1 hypothetical protein [Candidatus Competibacteraceae bacterium]
MNSDLDLMTRDEMLAEILSILETEPSAAFRANLFLEAMRVDRQAVQALTEAFKASHYEAIDQYRKAILSIVMDSERGTQH